MLLFQRVPFLAALLLAGVLVTLATAQVVQVQITLEPVEPVEPAREPLEPAGEPVAHPTWQPRPPATQPTSESLLQTLFSDLAASDAAVRDRAQSALLELTRTDLPALRNVVERSRPIAPSQAAALRDIVRHVYLTGETYDCEPAIGFLGLILPSLDSVEVPRPEGEPQPPVADVGLLPNPRLSTGVPIDYRIPGFCAFRALRDGDVVLGVVHPISRRMANWTELTRGIQSFRAGDRITLQVLRRGTVLNVPVTLDAKPLLPNENIWANHVLPARDAAADAYWTKHFAPLIEERTAEVSMTAPE